jgi:hypothetical protein
MAAMICSPFIAFEPTQSARRFEPNFAYLHMLTGCFELILDEKNERVNIKARKSQWAKLFHQDSYRQTLRFIATSKCF